MHERYGASIALEDRENWRSAWQVRREMAHIPFLKYVSSPTISRPMGILPQAPAESSAAVGVHYPLI